MILSRLSVLGAAVLFSTGGAAIKSCDFSAWQVAGLRSGIALIAVWTLVPAARSRWTPATLVTAVAYAATMVLFVSANKLTTAASTIFLQSTAPLYMLLIGAWWLREPVRPRDLLFLALFAVGLATFLGDVEARFASAPDPARGNLLGALSGISWALTVAGLRSIEKRPGDGTRSPAVLVAGNAITLAVCLPWALPLDEATGRDWALVLYLGVFQVGLAYLLLGYGVRRVHGLEASFLLLLEPVLNPVWAWVVHGERPGAWALAGGALILGGTALKLWIDTRAPSRLAAQVSPSP